MGLTPRNYVGNQVNAWLDLTGHVEPEYESPAAEYIKAVEKAAEKWNSDAVKDAIHRVTCPRCMLTWTIARGDSPPQQ